MRSRKYRLGVWAAALSVLGSACGGGGGSSPAREIPITLRASGARSEVPIQISPVDVNRASGAETPLRRVWREGTEVQVTAPAGFGDRQLQIWQRNGQDWSTDAALRFEITEGDAEATLTAVYVPRACGPEGFTPNYAGEIDPQDQEPNLLVPWDHLPVRVFFTPGAASTSTRQSQAIAGFDQWVRTTGGIIAYERTDDPAAADVTISFADEGRNGFEGQTHFVIAPEGDRLESAHIVINLFYLGQRDVRPVCAHEFGHALGVIGHSNTAGDLMFTSGSLTGQVTARDLNTLESAYCSRFIGRSAGHRAHTPRAAGGVRVIRCPAP